VSFEVECIHLGIADIPSEGLALRRPPLSSAAVHREIGAIARAQGWREPSYATVYSIIQALPADLVSLA
jgi:putative transposase